MLSIGPLVASPGSSMAVSGWKRRAGTVLVSMLCALLAPTIARAVEAPIVTGTTPTSPASANALTVFGTAVPGAIVRMYKNSLCLGSPVATGTAATFASPGIGVAAASNQMTLFYASAQDSTGDPPACSTTFATYVEDSIAPLTSLDETPPSTSGTATARFVFSSTDPAATFVCGVDGAALTPCTSPFGAGPLAVGPHSFSVAAIDLAGNQDPTPSTFDWSVAANTTITSRPPNAASETSAAFGFVSPTPGVSFLCSLDGAPAGPCAAPALYAGLADGWHTFTVAAVTPGAVVDPTPAVATWRVDTAPPDTSILSGPSASTESASATLAFASTELGATFECRLDGSAWVGCVSPHVYAGLANGAHIFNARAIDEAGNVDATPAVRRWATALPLVPDGAAPGRVKGTRAIARNRRVDLWWTRPTAPDIAFVEIRRMRIFDDDGNREPTGARRLDGKVVYRGGKRRFTDRAVRNGRTYRYTLFAVDLAGNRSQPRRITAAPSKLFGVAAGARVSERPMLRWTRVKGASFYNVQLFLKGEKIFTAWPNRARLRVPKRWIFEGERYRWGSPGRVDWFVFPASGERASPRFKKLLGKNFFIAVRER